MLRWVHLIVILVLSLSMSSCGSIDSLTRRADYYSFRVTGGTLFSKPNLVTTKELHFDTGRLLGREVILEGRIEEIGKYLTYIVISDESGRMLVVLTNIENLDPGFSEKKVQIIKVLGSVERGKKGLPYILASSINIVKTET